MLDPNKIKKDIPIFKHHPDLIYLDSNATALTPKCVLDKMDEYYHQYGVNIHRGIYSLGYRASQEYDIARVKVANFINAKYEEVVFTKGTTNSLNMLAKSLGDDFIREGDEIITSELEHHSSLLPWMQVAKEKGAVLKYVPLDKEGRITVRNFKKVLSSKTKIVALTYVSNVFGYITPVKEITALAREYNAIVIIDAAQAAPHFKIDVKEIDCDFLAFSGHKIMGPTGIGVLYGKEELLNQMKPVEYGGDMNDEVSLDNVVLKRSPFRFEAGTPPIAEAIGLAAAIDYLEMLGFENIIKYENMIHKYALSKLEKVDGVTIYNPNAELGVINFNINGVHPHDATTFFDQENISLRAGHHCAQLVSKWLNCNGTLRASFYIYNDKKDVDAFVETLVKIVEFFRGFN